MRVWQLVVVLFVLALVVVWLLSKLKAEPQVKRQLEPLSMQKRK